MPVLAIYGSYYGICPLFRYNVLIYLCMSTEQILDFIINYAYTRKEEIEKHRVLLGNDQSSNNNPSRQIDDGKIKEIDNWIKFLIDIKNGKLDLSRSAKS
jgi:hypothetical protein